MLAYKLFHPNHVVPLSEFITAFVEMCAYYISKCLVKFYTVRSEMLIFCVGICNAGIQIQYSLCFEYILKTIVKKRTYSPSVSVLRYVNAGLYRPVICRTLLEQAYISISEYFSVRYSLYVRIFFESICYPRSNFPEYSAHMARIFSEVQPHPAPILS